MDATASAPATEGGRRRHSRRHHKGTKKVSARTIRATLRKLHMRPKGRVVLKGGDNLNSGAGNSAPVGGKKKRRPASRPASLGRMLGL